MTKVTELRPCDRCGGQITPTFYRIRIEHLAVDMQAVREVLGTAMITNSLELGRVLSDRDATTRLTSSQFDMCIQCVMDDLGLANLRLACLG